ncbi:MAG: SPOR domain-containing protein, partial [Candidatus Eiseniibacteriota bacterium]
HAAVPVPEPTAALGERPASAELAAAGATGAGAAMAADSLSATGAGAASAKSPAAAPNSAATPAGPCYRLQVAAPTDHAQAESMRKAAESQLELPFAITHVKTLYKVRTRDCLNQEAVEHLRSRARASGFSGAFTVVEGAR